MKRNFPDGRSTSHWWTGLVLCLAKLSWMTRTSRPGNCDGPQIAKAAACSGGDMRRHSNSRCLSANAGSFESSKIGRRRGDGPCVRQIFRALGNTREASGAAAGSVRCAASSDGADPVSLRTSRTRLFGTGALSGGWAAAQGNQSTRLFKNLSGPHDAERLETPTQRMTSRVPCPLATRIRCVTRSTAAHCRLAQCHQDAVGPPVQPRTTNLDAWTSLPQIAGNDVQTVFETPHL